MAILNTLSVESVLTTLYISFNNISKVDPELLAKALKNLKNFDIYATNKTQQ